MPASDLEGNTANFPRTAGHRQRALDPACVQHIDDASTQGDGSANGDGIDEAAVEVVLAVDLNRWPQPRHRTGGQNGRDDRPAAEPPRASAFEAGRNALNRQLKITAVDSGKHVVQNAAQRLYMLDV